MNSTTPRLRTPWPLRVWQTLEQGLRATACAVERRRWTRATHQALGALDERGLRDLGLDRNTFGSIAAEAHAVDPSWFWHTAC